MGKSLIEPIPSEKQKGRNWIVKINNQEISDVNLLEIENPNYGIVSYGLTKDGYDGWSFRDVGGAVTIPFCFYNGKLFVGVIQQCRHNQGGYVWNVPRGFLNLGEDLHTTAQRELVEESGYSSEKHQIIQLPGESGNCNSAFFETPDESNAVAFYAVEIDKSELNKEAETLVFKPEMLNNSEENLQNRSLEMIKEMKFILWTEAALLSDMFSNTAVARLIAYLNQNDSFNCSKI